MTNRVLISAGLAVILLSGCASSGASNVEPVLSAEASPQQVEFSDARLDALDQRMKQFVLDGQLFGIHTRLVQGGEILSETTFGLRDVIDKKPVEKDTIYRIYSMTKPITGVAMMQLYEQGKWKLDDPVTKFVPEFESMQVLAGKNESGEWLYEAQNRAPTMAELMSHTAGYGYGLAGDDPVNSAFRDKEILRSPDLDSMIEKIADTSLLFQPGENGSTLWL